ncbi:acetylcholine receptor subunit alpha-like 1 [Babylonia areolata]|uniref:acetylcholine receptor subunit alpha-like 1 n=1 Tax=Babylonia areolata TaxID=304850 RepID=UPI003FD045D7
MMRVMTVVTVMVVVVVVMLGALAPTTHARKEPDPSAKRLHYDLMSSYNALVKPSGGPNHQLTVKMGLRLSQVLDVDEKNQIITISVWLRQEWDDLRLKWDPSDYGGVHKLNIPSDDLWKPDIVLYNNADGDFVVTLKTKATVYHTGKIVWEPPAIYKSYCPINVEFFPFDMQECFMKFSSWTYNGFEVDLQHVCNGTTIGDKVVIQRGIDMKDYYFNVEWDVLNVTARRNVKFYPCCTEPYPDITFNLTLRRRTLFYTLNLIMPCIAISCLTVLVFYLPSDSGEKITLSISILLALTVFFLLLSDMNPPTSLVIPLIGKYLLFIMIVVTASIFLTVYTLHINFKTPTTDQMSPWVKRIFTEILPRALLMKRPDMEVKNLKMGTALSNRVPNNMDGHEVPPEGDWGAYENLRQRHESGESVASSSVDNTGVSTRFPPEVMDALKGVRFIANHLRQSDKELAEERDWKYICMVIDRFFLYIFTTACFGGTLSIFLYAPSLYDPRNHIALVDPNSTCQY